MEWLFSSTGNELISLSQVEAIVFRKGDMYGTCKPYYWIDAHLHSGRSVNLMTAGSNEEAAKSQYSLLGRKLGAVAVLNEVDTEVKP
jgi:hypothetical protein